MKVNVLRNLSARKFGVDKAGQTYKEGSTADIDAKLAQQMIDAGLATAAGPITPEPVAPSPRPAPPKPKAKKKADDEDG